MALVITSIEPRTNKLVSQEVKDVSMLMLSMAWVKSCYSEN